MNRADMNHTPHQRSMYVVLYYIYIYLSLPSTALCLTEHSPRTDGLVLSIVTRRGFILTMVLLVGSGLEVLFWGDCFYTSKVVQHPHLGDVHLGEEPVVV